MPGQDMLLNSPAAKEQAIRPELTASQRERREIETTAAHGACPLRNPWGWLPESSQTCSREIGYQIGGDFSYGSDRGECGGTYRPLGVNRVGSETIPEMTADTTIQYSRVGIQCRSTRDRPISPLLSIITATATRVDVHEGNPVAGNRQFSPATPEFRRD